MNEPEFNIAVTVVARNAASTITQALESIATQDYDDFQVVFFDDASSDSTLELAARFESRCNLTLASSPIHIGKASAQAAAYRLCKSRYVIGCDADDRLRPGALKLLAETAARTEADIVMAPMMLVTPLRTKFLKLRPAISSLNDMPIDTVHFSLCNKLLTTRLALQHCMPYPGIDRWEDLGIVARFMTLKPKIAQIDTPVYDYVRHPGLTTLTTSSKDSILADRLAMTHRLISWFTARNLDGTYAEFIRHLKFYARIKLIRRPGIDLRKWAATFPEINNFTLQLRHVPILPRIICRFLQIFVD